MAGKIVLADTSILIDYFRKTDKANTLLVSLYDRGYDFCISAITFYEIYSGATAAQLSFWEEILGKTVVLPFDKSIGQIAVDINNILKRKRMQIGIADLFIAATALANTMPLATLNTKHFNRINGLELIQ